jgi:UDP-glucuronate decarboxylase
VDDLIEGFIRFMALPTGEDGAPGFPGPINLGNPGEFTIRQLAEKIISITGSKSKLTFKPLPQDDPMQRQPDISRARAHLAGWEPLIRLDEGLTRTVSYFNDLLSRDE